MAKVTKVSVKYYLMNTAHVLDVFRVIPRIMVAGYGYLVWDSFQWFQSLPVPTIEHSILISTIVGGAAAVFGLYVNSGAKWVDAKSAKKDLYEYEMNTDNDVQQYFSTQDNMEMPTRKRGSVQPEINETPPDDFLDDMQN